MRPTQEYKIDKDKIAYRIIDTEAIILNSDTGFYCSLNKTGTVIWELLYAGKPLAEVLAALKEKYAGVEAQILERDLADLIKKLVRKKIITP